MEGDELWEDIADLIDTDEEKTESLWTVLKAPNEKAQTTICPQASSSSTNSSIVKLEKSIIDRNSPLDVENKSGAPWELHHDRDASDTSSMTYDYVKAVPDQTIDTRTSDADSVETSRTVDHSYSSSPPHITAVDVSNCRDVNCPGDLTGKVHIFKTPGTRKTTRMRCPSPPAFGAEAEAQRRRRKINREAAKRCRDRKNEGFKRLLAEQKELLHSHHFLYHENIYLRTEIDRELAMSAHLSDDDNMENHEERSQFTFAEE